LFLELQQRFWSLLPKKNQKKQNPFIFLATYWKLSSKSGDLEMFFFQIWRIWAICTSVQGNYICNANGITPAWDLVAAILSPIWSMQSAKISECVLSSFVYIWNLQTQNKNP
jgi:hypothetical protein